MKNKKLPELPKGIRLGERPHGIEYQTRGDGVWLPVIENLKVLDNTATIQIDITGLNKQQIISRKNAIKNFAKKVNFTKKIKFAIQSDILHLWS